MNADAATVDLYWLPLGAGGHSVRFNGLVFEALAAGLQRRPRRDLYHSALEVRLGPEMHVIEMAPVWSDRTRDRGVVAEGAVGSRPLGRFRLFRYEIRCWRAGRIPDVADAVDSPQRLSEDPGVARRACSRSRSRQASRSWSGAATSCERVRCGTPTRSSPGWRSGPGSTPASRVSRRVAVPRGGMRDWWPRPGNARGRATDGCSRPLRRG